MWSRQELSGQGTMQIKEGHQLVALVNCRPGALELEHVRRQAGEYCSTIASESSFHEVEEIRIVSVSVHKDFVLRPVDCKETEVQESP